MQFSNYNESKMNTTPLRAARQARGITLTDLAEKAKTDIGHLSRIERGEASASPSLAESIVAVLGGEFLHEMQVLYPERYRGKKTKVVRKAPALRVTVGNFVYALVGSA